MSDIVIQSLIIIIPIGALVLGLHYFHTKQINTLEDRLREDRRDSENRLRAEIKVVADSVETARSELRTEIAATEERLRAEITDFGRSVEKGDSDLSHRIDRMDDKISRLIQDVGVVQGAVLGVSVEPAPREQPAGTN